MHGNFTRVDSCNKFCYFSLRAWFKEKPLNLMALYHAGPAINCSQYSQQAVEKNAHGGERYNSNSMANHAFNLKLIWKLAT
jgi:hypothetical protein